MIMEDLREKGMLIQGKTEIVEGSSGSTGISLSMMARVYGASCTIFMPSDQSIEKQQWMRIYGANLVLVPPASYANPENYVKRAQAYAAEKSRNGDSIVYVDQFESSFNHQVHYETTGPEIWYQTAQQVDAVVLSAGTAGTISGVGQYLKEQNPNILVILADPEGSGIYNLIKHGTLYTEKEKEGTRKRNQTDSIVQGVGMNRMTGLLSRASHWIDDAVHVPDDEVKSMSLSLLQQEGLFVGSSSALNVAAAVQIARDLGPGHTIVTILPDAGHRHWSSLHKP